MTILDLKDCFRVEFNNTREDFTKWLLKSNNPKVGSNFFLRYIGEENSITIRLSKYGNPLFVNPYMDHVVRNCVGLKMDDEVKEEFIRMSDYLEYEGFNSIEAIYVGSQANIRGRVDFSKFISSGSFMSLVFVAEVD